MSLPALTEAWTGRRRAWLLAGCAGLMVLTYLLGWTAYAANGLSALGRLQQLAPGQAGTALGVEYRLLSLTQTVEIRDQQSTDRSEVAMADATWVVAELEVTRRRNDPNYTCTFELVGPDRRRWETDAPSVQRSLPSYCTDDKVPMDRPTRVEAVFLVPNVFVDRLYGVAVPDTSVRRATPVLRPPAP